MRHVCLLRNGRLMPTQIFPPLHFFCKFVCANYACLLLLLRHALAQPGTSSNFHIVARVSLQKCCLNQVLNMKLSKRFSQDFPSVFQHLGIDFMSVVESNQFFKPIDFVSHEIQIISLWDEVCIVPPEFHMS